MLEEREEERKIDIDSLPSAGYIREDGVTVVTTEWEE